MSQSGLGITVALSSQLLNAEVLSIRSGCHAGPTTFLFHKVGAVWLGKPSSDLLVRPKESE